MTKMSVSQENQRGALENATACLLECDRSLRLIETRTRLALERTGFDRLLVPVFDEVNNLRVNISKARGAIQTEYQSRQAAGWNNQE